MISPACTPKPILTLLQRLVKFEESHLAESSRCFADAVRRHEERTKTYYDAVAAREVRSPTAGAIDDEQLMFNE